MFSAFHIFVSPGGPQLGPVQSQLLCDVVSANGGVVERDAPLLASVGTSLSRRGRKKLVVASGRATIEQVENDILEAVISAELTREGECPRAGSSEQAARHGAEVVQRLRALNTPSIRRCGATGSTELVEDAAATVVYVSHLWISACVSSGAAVQSLLTSFLIRSGGDRLLSPEAPPQQQSMLSGVVDGGSVRPRVGEPAGRGARGFIPVFFAAENNADGSTHTEHVEQRRAETIRQLQRQGKCLPSNAAVSKRDRSVSAGDDRELSSSDEEHPTGGVRKRRDSSAPQWQPPTSLGQPDASTFHRSLQHVGCVERSTIGKAGADHDQSCKGVEEEKKVVSSAMSFAQNHRVIVDPHNRALARQAAFIDRVKPFVCQQQQAPATHNNHHVSMFDDDDDDDATNSDDGSDTTGRDRPTAAPEAPRVAQNQSLLTQLAELKSVYEATGDQWRMYAYNKAIGIIKRLPFQVEHVEQLASYHGIGQKILNKVREILATGTSTKLHVLRATPHVAAMEIFSHIWGVGPSTARRLAQHITGGGVGPLRSIGELRACTELENLLTPFQLVGLRHFEDLQERMPRAEVTALVDFVVEALKGVVGDKRAVNIDVVACGSYRRRKATSGDVDILICDRNGPRDATDGLLARLVHRLKRPFAIDVRDDLGDEKHKKIVATNSTAPSAVECRCGEGGMLGQRRQHAFIVEDLTVSHRGMHEVHSDSWFGVVQLPDCSDGEAIGNSSCPCAHRPPCVKSTEGQRPSLGAAFTCGKHFSRRMDIKVYPVEQFPFALLYFTGSDYFNRSMRLYCQKRGWSLSDKDLKPVVRVHGGKVHETSHGIAASCSTERDIFDAIGLPYKEPWERDV